MRSDHATTQVSFTTALLDPAEPPPRFLTATSRSRARCGLGVYRNNVAAGLLNVLATRFTTVRQIVGDDSFLPAARDFIIAHPPRSAVLMTYGSEFPDFVRRRGSAACFRYVADIAELELARGHAYHAADADPLNNDAFSTIPSDKFATKSMRLHPSVSLLTSRFPIVSVWQAHHTGVDKPAHARGAEAALISRPFLDVEVHLLPDGGYAFLETLRNGGTITDAANAGAGAAEAFDLTLNLSLLISSRIVIAIR